MAPGEWQDHQVEAIVGRPGFYRQLPALPGAVVALLQLADAGFRLQFCCAPVAQAVDSARDRALWVQQNFAALPWSECIVITGNKQVVQGDLLVTTHAPSLGASSLNMMIAGAGTPDVDGASVTSGAPTFRSARPAVTASVQCSGRVLFSQPHNRATVASHRIARWDDPATIDTIVDALFVKLPARNRSDKTTVEKVDPTV
jgi:5'(3')-deoxyribonucleotidase